MPDTLSPLQQSMLSSGPASQLTEVAPTPSAAEQEHQNSLFLFNDAKPRLQQLHSKWSEEVQRTQENRLIRNVDISPKKLREEGKLKPDETIIPIRVIDTNISREQPAYIQYLISPARQFIFTCLDNPSMATQTLERDVTTGVRYEGWVQPYFKVVDGAQAHGWDSVEVIFDETKPLHTAVEHIGHDNLFFGREGISLDPSEVVVRRYSVTRLQLMTFIEKNGFDAKQAGLLLDNLKALDKVDSNINIYKKYFKFKGVVYVAWYSMDYCNDWLKAPVKHSLGIRKQVEVMVNVPVPMTDGMGNPMLNAMGQPMQQMVPQPQLQWQDVDVVEFPIAIFIYKLTEEQTITSAKGRVFYDKFKQEGQTAIASGFTNGVTRACQVMGSVQGDVGSTAAPRQLDTAITGGALFDKEIKFFNMPYPDPVMLQALQAFDTFNSQETGQLTFAVNNRKDSRKTAKEISSAESEQTKLDTVQVVLWAEFLRRVGTLQWLIIQSQALQNKVKLCLKEQPVVGMGMQQVQTQLINDLDMIGKTYLVKPAGDTDVLERQQIVSQMQQDWPVFQQTELKDTFLEEYIRRRYPSMAEKWITQMQQASNIKNLLMRVAQMGQMLADPAKVAALSPQDKQTLQQIQQEVQIATQPQSPVTTDAPAQPQLQ